MSPADDYPGNGSGHHFPDVEDLLGAPSANDIPDAAGEDSKGPRDPEHGDNTLANAVAKWNADHPQDWPRSGGTCPACRHHKCFGHLPDNPTRWACFSASHEADSDGCGLPGNGVGSPSEATACWHGDALDLEAHERGITRVDVLRDDGYLRESVDDRPRIVVFAEMHVVIDQALDALSRVHLLFVRHGEIVEIVARQDDGRLALHRVESHRLRDILCRHARFGYWNLETREWVDRLPPMWVLRCILARGSYPEFRELRAIVDAPTLRADGSVLQEPGYDAASRLYLAPGGAFPPIPRSPDNEQVAEAIAALCDPLDEFPFVEVYDGVAALAAILTVAARHWIDGPVPAFAISATAAATGKTLLAQAVSEIGSGQPAAVTTVPRNDEEIRKKITTFAVAGSPVVLLDNIEEPLGSEPLAAALTANWWADRLLGGNRHFNGRLRITFLATGNNLQYRGDLHRRVIPILLDAGIENPEDRKGFRIPDLLPYLRERRPELLCAALTILVAFLNAGAPRHGGARLGGFEEWDDNIRSALIWAVVEDPCAGRARLRQEADNDRERLAELLAAWRDEYGGDEKLASDVIDDVSGLGVCKRLHAAIKSATTNGSVDARALGRVLGKAKGRIVDGLYFARSNAGTGGRARWSVRKVSEGGSDGAQRGGGAQGAQGGDFAPGVT